MSLRRFFIYSIAIHVLMIIVVLLYKPTITNKKPSGVFITRLISPNEFLMYRPPMPSLPQRRPSISDQSGHTVPIPKTEDRSPVFSEESVSKEDVPSTSLPSPSHVPSLSSPYPGQESKGGLESENLLREPSKPRYLSREKLFDRSIIGDLAKREVEKEKRGEKGRSLTFETKDYKFLIYNERLKERIESIWIYPHDAAVKGIYGDLIIRFTIKKNGTLGAVELIRTSGHQNLDDAAMKALRDGEPYWPLPDEWGMEAYTIVGHFVYTLYGYYLR